jgi:signal transduction histidine kinase/ligand-binding sensor protein
MRIACPTCTQEFEVTLVEENTQCPNSGCHARYHFTLLRDKGQAASFYEQAASWKPKSLFQPKDDGSVWVVSYFADPIEPYAVPSITSLVGEHVLRAIQAGFADNLGGPVTLIEILREPSGGYRLSRVEPLEYAEPHACPPKMRYFTRFCIDLRLANGDAESGDELCEAFDNQRTHEYLSKPPYRPKWHHCWCGLVDYVVPVMVNNQLVGVLLSGQRRLRDAGADANLTLQIEAASARLRLDPKHMTELARANDVKPVDEAEIKDDLRRLEAIAKHLEREAEHDYITERQVRESHFLEEIESMLFSSFTRASESEADFWQFGTPVLNRIKTFLGCFDDVALLQEASMHSGTYRVVAASGKPPGGLTITVPDAEFDSRMPTRIGPLLISPEVRSDLNRRLAKQLLPYLPGIGYVVRMPVRSERRLLLVLTSALHGPHSEDTPVAECDQCSRLTRRFLANLGDELSKNVEVLGHIQYLRAEERRKGAFLTRAAHGLSLPIQSILADSANLRDEIDKNNPLYEMAAHNFTEVQGLHLAVENILHGAEEHTLQPQPRFVRKSILEPLRQACEMFAGEAAEKGCDIRPVVWAGDSKLSLKPSEVSEANIYLDAIYKPLIQRVGLTIRKPLDWSEIAGARIVWSSGREMEVSPLALPRKCARLRDERRTDQTAAPRVILVIDGQQIEATPQEIGDKYMPWVEMVPLQIELALKNLVHNAVKYSYKRMPSGPARFVEVRCRLLGRRFYEIAIANYGIGILDNEIVEGLIWRPRYRGVLSADRNRSGSGLGLSHARLAIEDLHGGKIDARSMEQPSGAYLTIFTATLPIAQTDRLQQEERDVAI